MDSEKQKVVLESSTFRAKKGSQCKGVALKMNAADSKERPMLYKKSTKPTGINPVSLLFPSMGYFRKL